jgi:ribonuclease Z
MHFAFLGSGAAVASIRRDTTSLVFVGRDDAVLVDCGGSPIQKLGLAAVDPLMLSHVVITHIHPDHAYGLPSLVQSLLLLGRREPLTVACREEHVEPLQSVLAVFGLLDRPELFPVAWIGVPPQEGALVATTPSFRVSASPNAHGSMPNMAVRFDPRDGGAPVAYSSDTQPCDAVASLAQGAHTLVHEATFAERGGARVGAHSTAAEAGAIAARAGVQRLILAHIDRPYHPDPGALVEEARTRFAGAVEVADEFVPYPL